MSDLVDELIKQYPDDSKELQSEIEIIKRKMDIQSDDDDDDEKENKVLKKNSNFDCEICGKSFGLKKTLTRHILSHKTFFKCQFCERKFKRKDYLQNHIKRKHQQKGFGDEPSINVLNTKNTHQISKPALSTSSNQALVGNGQSSQYASDITTSVSPRHVWNDHDYTRPSTSDKNNLNSTSANGDHNYFHNTNQTQSALNQAVQDHKIYPSNLEKYDMLTFFANIKPLVEGFIKSRLMKQGIKWYLSVQVELVKDLPEQQTTRPHFRGRTYASLNIQTLDEHELNESFHKMFESFEKYIREFSGWVLKKVICLTIHTVIYSPLKGSSFMDLPKNLNKSQSLLNVRNLDQKCFLWCCLASLYALDSFFVSDYEPFEHVLNMKDITYPVSINQINQFEKQNPNISINVFTYEDKEVLPLRITKQKDRLNHINLLLLRNKNNSHYVLIKNLNCFLRTATKQTNCAYYCHYCLHGFKREILLNNHLPYCQMHGEQKIELPTEENCFLKFKDYEKTLRVPYVIYADFETLNTPLIHTQSGCTTKTQLLKPCSFGYKIVSTDPHYKKDTVIYRGPNASKYLLECLFRESHEIQERLKNIQPLKLTPEEEESFQKSKKCYLCHTLFDETSQRARHHDHTTGKYIGATHINCNLQCKQVKFIPVVFHNLKNFDAHLLCQSIGAFKNYRMQCIPQTIEKYVSFSLGNLRFIDSFGFLPSSLETLIDNLSQENTQSFLYFQKEINNHSELLLRKGVYPYEYMTSWEKFNEITLPSKSSFYSSLTKETISDQEYDHAKTVFQTFRCKNLGDYHDLYLKTDVLLLADVFENFRNTSQSCYGLDPCHFYTSPGLSWQAMLKMTGVCLELMTDIDHILFIESAIRGGISQISNRYAKANNSYMESYDSSKDTSFLAYYDVNNLYGFSMSEKLPVGFFRFLTPDEIETFNVQTISENGSKGYILEVDLDYPENLHDNHNDYPLAPERKFIPNERLSPYALKVWKKLHNEPDTFPPRAKVEKLLTTLDDKKQYVLHYRNLQLYLQLGLKLKKVHRILEFQQEAFMKPYIDFNTNKRQQAKTTFEKDFYKLMNNSCFGKTMENQRKHRSVVLCHTNNRLKKLTAKATYKSHRIFSEDLVGVELNRHKVKMNKPIYIGMSILDLSKRLMYDFYYNHLKRLYGENVQLQMTDTDSFLFSVKTKDIFLDMYDNVDLYDTSNFPPEHFLYSNVNKKVMGKMKSETSEKCISEYCGLRSKMYAFKCNNKDDKRAKGISKIVVKNDLKFQNYTDTLFNKTKLNSEMTVIRSYDHQLYCEKIFKSGLSCFDDKRYLLDNGISSLAYGHYKIKK